MFLACLAYLICLGYTVTPIIHVMVSQSYYQHDKQYTKQVCSVSILNTISIYLFYHLAPAPTEYYPVCVNIFEAYHHDQIKPAWSWQLLKHSMLVMIY